MDWTHSFIRGTSITKPFDEYPSPLTVGLNVTIVRLEFAVGAYGSLIAVLSGSKSERIVRTTAGIALIRFLEGIADEPGHEWTMWATSLEERDCILIFIGKASANINYLTYEGNDSEVPNDIGWRNLPSPSFASAEAFQKNCKSPALSSYDPYLRSEIDISNIGFQNFIATPIEGVKDHNLNW